MIIDKLYNNNDVLRTDKIKVSLKSEQFSVLRLSCSSTIKRVPHVDSFRGATSHKG